MTGSAGLADHHRNQLKASGISDEVISRRGYSTLDRRSNADASQRRKLKALGFSKKAWDDDQRFPGLLIPVYGPTGRLASHRYRPDRPRTDGKNRAVKYESPTGQASRIDVHPFHQDSIADPTVPLIITEGHKKADSITTAARAEGLDVAVAAIDGVFNWRGRHGTLGDWEDICLRGRAVHIVFDADAATNRNVASAMHRLGQWLKSKGAKVSYVVSPEVNGDGKTGADDYLAAGITLRSLLAVGQSRPPDPGAADDSLTDSRLAERVAREVLEDNYRWCQALSGWFCWTGARWERGSEEEVLERVRVHLQTLHKDAIDSRAPVDRLRAMAGLQQISRARSILAFTKGIDGVLTRHDEFDQHPDLLNCRNGVVDLRTGELMDPDPDLLLTKVVPVEYLPSASHEDWDKALEAMPDPETRDYLQVLMGQGATGHRPAEDRLTVAVGGGENGKSTLFGACRAALGDYALVASHRALMGDAKNHPTELMDFMGARFVMVEETPERGRLDTVALKTIIGTPFITARRMHKDSVEFATTHTAVINTNYLPTVDETDHGTWRRLSAIVFPLRYVNEPRRSNERQGTGACGNGSSTARLSSRRCLPGSSRAPCAGTPTVEHFRRYRRRFGPTPPRGGGTTT